MAKFEKVGSGFIKHDDALMNLRAYKEITKVSLPYDTREPNGIKFTPIQPLKEDYENNVDGAFYIPYSRGEEEEFEQDFILIQEALTDQSGNQ